MEKKGPRFTQARGKNPQSQSGLLTGLTTTTTTSPRNPTSTDHLLNSQTPRFISPTLTRARPPSNNEQIVRAVRPLQNPQQISRNSPHILQRNLNRSVGGGGGGGGGGGLNSGDIDHLSERIKREKLKFAQMKQDQVQTEKQVLYRSVNQKTPIITQRPLTQNTRPIQYRQNTAVRLQQGQMTPRSLQQQQQHHRMLSPNQQGFISPVKTDQRQRIIVNSSSSSSSSSSTSLSPQVSPRQRVTSTANTPIRGGNLLQNNNEQQEICERKMTQQSCTPKSELEQQNSSESYAYLQRVIADPHTAIVQQQITGNVAKMLVVLLDGEQRLITFDIPIEECTVQDLLEQVRVCLPFVPLLF